MLLAADIRTTMERAIPDDFSWWAIPSNPSIAFAAPTWNSTARFATGCRNPAWVRHCCGKPPFGGAHSGICQRGVRGYAGIYSVEQGAGSAPGQPAVIALPMPKPYGMRNITMKAIDAVRPRTVAAFIEWLLARKWRVSDREDPASYA